MRSYKRYTRRKRLLKQIAVVALSPNRVFTKEQIYQVVWEHDYLLDDSNIAKKSGENPNLYIIHDEDLLRVLNELRAAGAEAISVNDQRIVAMSEIRCAGPTISVNNVRSAPPYVIKAIGAPKTLSSALRLRGGVVETFEFWGIQVKIKTVEKLHIPALKAPRSFEYAKTVESKEAAK